MNWLYRTVAGHMTKPSEPIYLPDDMAAADFETIRSNHLLSLSNATTVSKSLLFGSAAFAIVTFNGALTLMGASAFAKGVPGDLTHGILCLMAALTASFISASCSYLLTLTAAEYFSAIKHALAQKDRETFRTARDAYISWRATGGIAMIAFALFFLLALVLAANVVGYALGYRTDVSR